MNVPVASAMGRLRPSRIEALAWSRPSLIVEMDPRGRFDNAHTIQEHVDLADVARAVDVFIMLTQS